MEFFTAIVKRQNESLHQDNGQRFNPSTTMVNIYTSLVVVIFSSICHAVLFKAGLGIARGYHCQNSVLKTNHFHFLMLFFLFEGFQFILDLLGYFTCYRISDIFFCIGVVFSLVQALLIFAAAVDRLVWATLSSDKVKEKLDQKFDKKVVKSWTMAIVAVVACSLYFFIDNRSTRVAPDAVHAVNAFICLVVSFQIDPRCNKKSAQNDVHEHKEMVCPLNFYAVLQFIRLVLTYFVPLLRRGARPQFVKVVDFWTDMDTMIVIDGVAKLLLVAALAAHSPQFKRNFFPCRLFSCRRTEQRGDAPEIEKKTTPQFAL